MNVNEAIKVLESIKDIADASKLEIERLRKENASQSSTIRGLEAQCDLLRSSVAGLNRWETSIRETLGLCPEDDLGCAVHRLNEDRKILLSQKAELVDLLDAERRKVIEHLSTINTARMHTDAQVGENLVDAVKRCAATIRNQQANIRDLGAELEKYTTPDLKIKYVEDVHRVLGMSVGEDLLSAARRMVKERDAEQEKARQAFVARDSFREELERVVKERDTARENEIEVRTLLGLGPKESVLEAVSKRLTESGGYKLDASHYKRLLGEAQAEVRKWKEECARYTNPSMHPCGELAQLKVAQAWLKDENARYKAQVGDAVRTIDALREELAKRPTIAVAPVKAGDMVQIVSRRPVSVSPRCTCEKWCVCHTRSERG